MHGRVRHLPPRSTPSALLSGELSVRPIQSLDELEQGPLAQSYRRFCAALPGFGSLGFDPAFLRVAKPAFTRSGERVWFLAVMDGADMIALAPFLRLVRGRAPLRFRQLRLWGKSGRYVEYPIVSLLALEGAESAGIRAVTDALEGPYASEWDELVLKHIGREDPFLAALSARFTVSSDPDPEDPDKGDHMHLFGSHEHIDEKLNSENRRRIRKTEERMREEFSCVEMVTVEAPDDALIDELRQLHIARQHDLIEEGRPRISFFEDPVENRATIDMMRVAQEAGGLRVHLLRIDGSVVGFWICFAAGGYAQAAITAVSPVPGHKYASSWLWRHMLVTEAERYGTKWLDAMWGSHMLKRKFSNTLVPIRSRVLQNNAGALARAPLGALGLVRRLKG